MKRVNLCDLSLKRIQAAAQSRLIDIYHSSAWNFSYFALTNREMLKHYHDLHKNERCFIVANGPSIQHTNLELLKNEITFGLNRIYLNFPSSDFRPTYYVAVNELVLEQFHSDIEKLVMPKFLNWNCRSSFIKTNDNQVFIKPKLVLNDYFEADITKPFVFGGTVTFVTLQLAYYMGFNEVIIVGLDHRYNEKGVPNEKETRSYEKDASHFHPDYFPRGSKWQLPDLARSEIDFTLARAFYEKNSRRIMDATIGGNCTIFEKIPFEKVFV